jgi:hypothetical protein
MMHFKIKEAYVIVDLDWEGCMGDSIEWLLSDHRHEESLDPQVQG